MLCKKKKTEHSAHTAKSRSIIMFVATKFTCIGNSKHHIKKPSSEIKAIFFMLHKKRKLNILLILQNEEVQRVNIFKFIYMLQKNTV